VNEIKKILAIIPTYNEIENITTVIERVLAADSRISIVVIDDASPDGTGEAVIEISERNSRVNLISRSGKLGLGTAYVAGFKYGLKNKYDAVVEIDADLSHSPEDIPRLVEYAENGADFVIGSRYKDGVNVVNWPLRRLLLSYGASIYSRIITGMPYRDLTAGFGLIRREVLEAINLDGIKSNGYSFQIEVKFKAYRRGFSLVECPIVFTERIQGHSKMNNKIILEAIFMVWKLRFGKMSK
jgi:dolichol-phosphate mannosyltransferase